MMRIASTTFNIQFFVTFQWNMPKCISKMSHRLTGKRRQKIIPGKMKHNGKQATIPTSETNLSRLSAPTPKLMAAGIHATIERTKFLPHLYLSFIWPLRLVPKIPRSMIVSGGHNMKGDDKIMAIA